MENEFHFLVSGPKNFEGDFRRTIEGFPEFTVQPVGEGALADVARHLEQEEKDTLWISEKEQLGAIVDNVIQAIMNQDTTALKNFIKLYEAQKKCISNWENNTRSRAISLEEFVLGAVRVFEKTVEGYRDESKSPRFVNSRNGRSRVVYRRPPGVPLSPRHVRLVVGKNGLDGQAPRPVEEMASEEDTEKQVVKQADQELVKAIFMPYFNRPQASRFSSSF